MDTRWAIVASRTEETDTICTVDLVAAQGDPLPAFSAGAHIDVHLPNGLTRQYSLCNPQDSAGHYTVGVLRDPNSRGGSVAMHGLKVGDKVEISVPRNHFHLVPEAKSSVLLAGGIGITPLLCMAERLSLLAADFDLHYCTRSESQTAFRGRIAASAFSDRVHYHFDDQDVTQRIRLEEVLSAPMDGKHLYVCGPKGFMDAVLAQARGMGWSEDSLHFEFFAGAPLGGDSACPPFEVVVASSGAVIEVPGDQSIVQALGAAGIYVPTSCEQGVCGTCLTRVLRGEPDHRDLYLTEEEKARNDVILPCCSRSKGRVLVLDV
ncbi:PDR/VanB family oxidoreductase [Ramlibacter albus]|uniref:Oxidoreductase n=1 Tax=Ramlibacter albus TaxID=2079448 RepID=A0A923M355_9BURK|nr:PDR/VanB family oxidoreductase [Ramlibacter albus]MBC5763050.1 oxidoreductase [Ramlibacter albus]